MDEGEREVVRDEFTQVIEWHAEISKLLKRATGEPHFHDVMVSAAILMLVDEISSLKHEITELNPRKASEMTLDAARENLTDVIYDTPPTEAPIEPKNVMDKVAEIEEKMP